MMKKKKYMKTGMDMAATGIGLGAASSAATSSPYAQAAIGKMGAAMPKVGTLVAGGMVMDAVGGLKKQAKKMKY